MFCKGLCVCVVLVLFDVLEVKCSGDITTHAALRMLKKHPDRYLVLDVRRLEEYRVGHLADAVLIDFYGSDYEKKLSELPEKKPIIIYCRVGRRSSITLKKMQKMGFKSLYNVLGGMEKWLREKKPVVVP